MKSLFLFIIIAVSSSKSILAQGNLQFNQVLSYSGSLSCQGTACRNHDPWSIVSPSPRTVPTGKIWKLESVGWFGVINDSYYNQPFLVINGIKAYFGLLNRTLSEFSNQGNLISSPVWLKENDIFNIGMLVNQPYPCPNCPFFELSYHISILEFNVVQ
jgi:hypothetical protein